MSTPTAAQEEVSTEELSQAGKRSQACPRPLRLGVQPTWPILWNGLADRQGREGAGVAVTGPFWCH